MASLFVAKRAVLLGLAALVIGGVLGCGDDHHHRAQTTPGSVDAADIAGTWNGTISIAGVGDGFAVTFDCAGAFTGTVGGQAVSGQVTAFDSTTGVFSATMTVGSETRTLAGVAHAGALTGSFTSDMGPGGNFVVSFAAGTALVCNFDFAADTLPEATISTQVDTDPANTSCNGDAEAPYTSDEVAASISSSTSDGATVIHITLTFPDPADAAGPGILVFGDTASSTEPLGDTITFDATGFGGQALVVTITLAVDGTLSGTFTGTIDAEGDGSLTGATDCAMITGSFTGTFE